MGSKTTKLLLLDSLLQEAARLCDLWDYSYVQGSEMAVAGVKNMEIPRVADLSPEQFHREFFTKERPVIITDAAEDWPCRQWTIEGLAERVGENEVMVRG